MNAEKFIDFKFEELIVRLSIDKKVIIIINSQLLKKEIFIFSLKNVTIYFLNYVGRKYYNTMQHTF
ncbi:hypothetical protein BpHYR1_039811 [Brachionus plicatilis]|uniref:Uncharacterized protein n=1 Tax=Brachionus plicatilis TaxID=10195 RepID=A0A3M7Q7V7_BRAPC|nr:hypothetical protein BpHYR1_039811 [Brachionus plicatilis]